MPLIGRGIGHRFTPGPVLFEGVNFAVTPGLITGIVGPSGSGKSTLLGVMAGWIDPELGVIDRSGISKMNWVFQNPAGVSRRTVLDHICLPLLARGIDRRAAEPESRRLLDEFGLSEQASTRFGQLSGGEAQRLMLARSIAAQPDLLLVDEPTAQLDSRTSAQVVRYLRQLSNDTRMVVISTHDEHTRSACDTIIDLSRA
jgi:putative ABC transport system ATP-binding protein